MRWILPFIMLVAASAAFTLEPLPCIPSCPTTAFSGIPWVVIAVIAVAAAYVAAAIAYMIGKAFSSTEIIVWGKNEIYQASATLIIVLFLLVAENTEFEVLKGFGYSPTVEMPNPAIAGADAYLSSVCGYAGWTLVSLTNFHTVIQTMMFSVENIKDTLPGDIVTFSGRKLGRKLTYQIRTVFSMLETPTLIAVMVTTIQQILMCLVKNAAFHLLLPIGIVLRAIPFLRRTGSAIMALAIGLYLVFPLTFLLNEKMVSYYKCGGGTEKCEWDKEYGTTTIVSFLGAGGTIGIGTLAKYFASIKDEMGESMFTTFLTGHGGAFLSLSLVTSLLLVLQTVFPAFFGQVAFVVVVLGMLLPLLNLVITAGVTREIAKVMGSDIELTSLLKVL